MKEKYFYCFCIFFVLILFGACKSKNDGMFLVEGKIDNLENKDLYILTGNILANEFKVDSISCDKNGKFSYKGESDTLTTLIIYMENRDVWVTAWVKGGQRIDISGDVKYPELIMIKGGEINDMLSKFKDQNKDLMKQKRDLIDRKNGLDLGDIVSSERNDSQYASRIMNINYDLKSKAEAFIEENPESEASLVLLQDFVVMYGGLDEARNYLSKITGKAKESFLYKEYSKEINDLIKKVRSVSVGSFSPEFEVVTLNNDTLTLDSFSGKHLLISFTASWCEFCENDHKELIKLRKNVSEDKLGMLTISLEDDKNAWKDILKKEKMEWYQSVDTTGWLSPMASLFNIIEIPANILIDNNKIIVGRDLPIDKIADLIDN